MHVEIIGVPVDFGAGRRGVDMGPSAIRYAELRERLRSLGVHVTDRGNVAVPLRDNVREGDQRLKYLTPIVGVYRRLARAVSMAVERGRVPLVLGGDHGIALGSISGAARHKRLGVIWLDTHADFNTRETTPSGNIHGMPLAALCGYGHEKLVTLGGKQAAGAKVEPANVAVVGARDLDAGEKRLLLDAGVRVFSIGAIDRYGINEVMLRAIEIAGRGTDGIYASVDLDVLDPTDAPGVGTPMPGGLTRREAHLALELVAESGLLCGLDMVEVNPILDNGNKTGKLAVELILSALGKTIWEEAAAVAAEPLAAGRAASTGKGTDHVDDGGGAAQELP